MEKNKRVAKKVQDLAPSGIREFFDLVIGRDDVVSLGVGEPDFDTPWLTREAAIYTIEKGLTCYTSNWGLLALRKTLATFLEKKLGVSYDPEQEIMITTGVSEAVDLVMRAVINPGDKILIPEPSYVSYGPTVDMAGGTPVFLKTRPENGFKVTPEMISKSIDSKVKGFLFNYPCNPTGTSYTKQELQAIAKVIKKHDLLVFTDEIYDDLTYDQEHTSIASLPGMRKNTVYLNGFSKGYAMTGFRIGYVCGPKDILAGMLKIHQYTMLCAPTIGQFAAIEALKHGQKDVRNMVKEYKRRRNYLVKNLNEIGLSCHMPQGAFYVFPSIKATGLDSKTFAKKLLDEENIAAVPGTGFGPIGEGYLRMAYAASFENIKEAIVRIKRFLDRHKLI